MEGHISAFPSAWFARYADMPLFPARSSLPDYDGDMIGLRHTAEQIVDIVSAELRRITVPPSDRYYYNLTVDRLGYNPRHLLSAWPADRAGELLAAWRADR